MRVLIGTIGVLAAFVGGCRPPMPTLSEPVGGTSAEALHAALSKLAVGECRTRNRKAENTGEVPVQICGVQGGQYAGGSDTPVNGVPVARMRNLGNRETDLWRLNPGPYESYIIVYGDPTSQTVKYDVIEVSTTSPAARPPRVAFRGGTYKKCEHNYGPAPARARASFGTCADRPGGADDVEDPAPATFRQTYGVDGPAWIVCGGDCCTTEPQ